MRLIPALLIASVLMAGPCDQNPVVVATNHGDVIRAPRVHFVFWGSYWLSADGSAAADLIVRSFGRVSPTYFSGITQYGAGIPTFAGMTVATLYEPVTSVPVGVATTSGADIAMLVQNLIDSRMLRGPEADPAITSYYVVLLPPGVATGTYRAFHDSLTMFNGALAHFAWIMNTDFTFSDVLHELIEGITDPTGNGVRVPLTPPKGQIADACENLCAVYRVSGIRVPAYWSQADGACVAPGATEPIRSRQ